MVRLNAAIALAQLGPRQAALRSPRSRRLADRLDGYHLWHATRAELLRLTVATPRRLRPTREP